jgi:tRNA threonylcarbamoyl adenosine modification protein YeaZ
MSEERRTDQRGAHAELLPIYIKELLEVRGIGIGDLDGVVLSAGPGSYTGLRIGASIVKGLLFGRSVPFVAVNTLAALAQGVVAHGHGVIHSVIDARRTHLYHQQFRVEGGMLRAVDAPSTKELAEVNTIIQPGDVVVGTGWNRLDAAVMAGVKTLGLETISAANVDALYRNWRSPKDAYGEGVIRHARIEIFEPDYRGNPYQ